MTPLPGTDDAYQPRPRSTQVILVLIIFLFLFCAVIADIFRDEITHAALGGGIKGQALYVLVTAGAVVVAPISVAPLIPLASMMWGVSTAALLSITGWVLGAEIAFILARRYGRNFIRRIVSSRQIEKMENILPHTYIFWKVILLRMTIPVDVLSYALGLFSSMGHMQYFFSTLLGVTPFAFIFASFGAFPLTTQVVVALSGLALYFLIEKLRKR